MNRSEEDALTPFVSILVPTYNRADMLDQTLDSLLNQNYPKDKFELIVIDNNSSDHTREIVTDTKQCPSMEWHLWSRNVWRFPAHRTGCPRGVRGPIL